MALPLQILPQEESFGGKLGTGLGSGIGAGLQNLAQMKLNEISQQKQAARQGKFWQDLGLPPSIGSLPPQVQKGLLDRLEGINLGGQPQGIQAMQQMQQVPKEGEIPTQVPEASGRTGITLGASPTVQYQRERIATKKEEIAQNKSIEQQKREDRLWKESAPFRKELLDNKLLADRDIKTLDYMEELEKSGNLISPQAYTLLQKAGFDFPWFYNSPESEAYEKASLSFTRNAKQIYGGRVTNFELEQFIKQIPTLRNTPEGRKLISAQWRLLADTNKALYDAQEKVIERNGGFPPPNFGEQVEKESRKRIDKLGKKFKHGIQKSLGREQTYGEEGLVPLKKQTTAPTEEGTQFLKNGEHLIIENGKAVPYNQRGKPKAELRTVSF